MRFDRLVSKLTMIAVLSTGLIPVLFAQKENPEAYEYLVKGDSCRIDAEFGKARYYLHKADSIYRAHGIWRGVIQAGSSMARMELTEKKYAELEERIHGLFEIAEDHDIHGAEVAFCYNLLGAVRGEWQSDFEGALELHQEALAALDTSTSLPARYARARTIGTIGTCYGSMGHFENALAQYYEAIDTFINLEGDSTHNVAIGYGAISEIYTMRAQYDSAIYYGNKALAIQYKTLTRVHFLNMTRLRDLGDNYRLKGDLDRARVLYDEAYEMALELYGEESYDVAAMILRQAYLDRLAGKLVDARAKVDEALAIAQTVFPDGTTMLEGFFLESMTVAIEQGDYVRALKAAKSALAINVEHRPDHPGVAESYKNLGEVQYLNGSYEEALASLESAQRIASRLIGGKHPLKAQIHLWRSKVYQALERSDLAWAALGEAFDNYRVTEDEDAGLLSLPGVLDVYQMQIELLAPVSGSGRPRTGHKQLINAIKESLHWVDQFLASYLGEGTRLYWSDELSGYYSMCLTVLHDRYDDDPARNLFTTALLVTEHAKTNVRRQRNQVSAAIAAVDLPEDIAARERTLRGDLRLYSGLLGGLDVSTDAEQLRLWSGKFKEKAESYEELMGEIRSRYPEYFTYRYAFPELRFAELQSVLGDGRVIVNYFFADSNVHVQSFAKNNYSWSIVPTATVRDNVQILIEIVSSYSEDPAQLSAFKRAAGSMYHLLAEDVIRGDTVKEICIIADAYLSYLPFEVLLPEVSDEGGWSELQYLVKDICIAYYYSLAQLSDDNGYSSRLKAPYTGFAPSFAEEDIAADLRGQLGELPFTVDEVKECADIWNGVAFTGPAASKQNFYTHGTDSRICHLAMHALVNDSLPLRSRLIFDPRAPDSAGVLFAHELYSRRINSDLVILSACESGIGRYMRGDGLQSLAQAFSYSGVPAVCASLWKVSDRPTKEIITDFLLNLKTGKDKPLALRQAKLHYLNRVDDMKKHPYFWAGIIAIGDDSPVQQRGWPPYVQYVIYFAITLGFIILLWFVFRKYGKQ